MYEYKIGRNFAVADVNADVSGLSESDIEALDAFTADLIQRHGHALYTVTEWHEGESDINGRCDISGLMDFCVTIEISDKN